MDRSGRVDFAGKARKKDQGRRTLLGTTALQSIPNTLSFPTSCPPLQIISTGRATLITSPCGDIRNVPFLADVTTIEMSPNLEVSTGGQIGKDSDER